ncbi:MAG: hypothetical protein KBD25_01475 [Rickettsiaceae bacterium]|nr:hypothetical protein [Rickettsiaceae bacterium]
MIEQLRQNVNKIRRTLSWKFLLLSYISCSIFDIFLGKYMELGLVLVVIASLIWVIKNTEQQYNKINASVAAYRQADNTFIIDGLINTKTVFSFILSFLIFVALQLLICPAPSMGAFFGYFLYMAIVMFAINGEYNPLTLEKQKHRRINSDITNDEYIFSENMNVSGNSVDATWYSDPCLPGNPIYTINK